MNARGFLGDLLWGVAAGMGFRIGWGLIEWVLTTFLHAVR